MRAAMDGRTGSVFRQVYCNTRLRIYITGGFPPWHTQLRRRWGTLYDSNDLQMRGVLKKVGGSSGRY